MVVHTLADLGSSESLAQAIQLAILEFGGLDVVVNTAAIYSVPGPDGKLSESQWSKTFQINVTGHYLLAQEAEWVFRDQKIGGAMVLTSSANAVVSKQGTEAYDTSKAAVNHLVRELAVGLGPDVRVNGIAPATVVSGSTMFPRDRVMHSLKKYNVAFLESESTEELRSKLAEFYARRTLTRKPISPQDCANAIVWLAGDQSAKTTGHIIPVDGGLQDAFLR
jgi:NAD(P)-dependent dehydrogenase (short-subunit alcohol dehydrogenase family)